MKPQYEQFWREFEDNELSHSEAHYLLSIYSLSKKSGDGLIAADLSRELGVSRNAVSLQLKRLSAKRLTKTTSGNITLTRKGVSTVERVANKRQTMIVFFSEVLGLDRKIASQDSCKIEHLLSDDTGEALLSFVKFLRSDRKVVLNFLKEFQRFYLQCDPEISCGLCENIHQMENMNEI